MKTAWWALGAAALVLMLGAATLASRAPVDGDWTSYGRTLDEQRYSPLDQINAGNVGRLGLAWYADLDTARGQESTPLVVDGTLYVSTAWSLVKAFDATTGKLLWSYDPQVPRETLVKACCDAVNRGVAVAGGKVYVGALDGRLIALDAKTGKPVWSTWTVDPKGQNTITGAPRIVRGKVIIGNAGAEYDARGYVSAYDAQSGKLVWRFYTVPGDPSKPFEQPELARAAKTWSGEWWKYGGGGTVWDAITYDEVSGLLFFGTGNGEPWNKSLRGAEGDNLFTSSIVAVDPDTGRYAWHYQETPQDRWDFDSDQQIIAATLKIDGQNRRVVMHAPKNGVFYVLDAKTGQFLSGTPYTKINWARGFDPKTGRPDIAPEALYDVTGKPFTSVPGAAGAHSWQPMSYSPKTGLVYIPVNEASYPYAAAGKDWRPQPLGFNTGMDAAVTAMPADAKIRAEARGATTGRLLAWNPVARRAAWSVAYPGPWNGGTLATAGDLVFQGTAGQQFIAYAADSGRRLWSTPVQTGIIAGPMTYSVKGVQYVAVMAGWGGVWDVATGVLADKSGSTRNISRLLVYKLGGKAQLPPPPPASATPLDPPPVTGEPQQIAEGAQNYARYCVVCHGDAAVAGGLNPDLRHSGALNTPKAWQAIVHDGALKDQGMVGWGQVMTPAQVETIRLYVIKRANEDKRLQTAQGKP